MILKSTRWMWNGWNQPPDGFLISQISVVPGASLHSGLPYLLSTTSTHVLPLTVHMPFVRTSSNVWSGAPTRSGSSMISLLGLRKYGVVQLLGKAALPSWLVTVDPTSKRMMSRVESKSTLFGRPRFLKYSFWPLNG